MATQNNVVRVAAVGDLHCTKTSQPRLQQMVGEITGKADVLLLCGDLTDYGLTEEAHVLAKELSALKIPIVGVLGNHDFESGQHQEVAAILCEAGLTILDGDAIEVEGIGIAGVKGFCGGFGSYALGPWGESIIKNFVKEAVDEALKLEAALARLRTPYRIALLHYSPVRATVEGEPPEIFAYLGCSRLEDPLTRYPVNVVLHGHAHSGSPEGRTTTGIPVYNVALPLLKRRFPDHPSFRLLEIPVATGALV